MERQNLDEQRCLELTAQAREVFPASEGPPLPGTICKVGDDLMMFGMNGVAVRVLGNASGPGFFLGYTDPEYLGVDGWIEWPYAEEYINDRAPLDPQEPPMPVYVEDPEPGQQQQGQEAHGHAQHGAEHGSGTMTLERALQYVLVQVPHDKRRAVRDKLYAAVGLPLPGHAHEHDLGDHRHNAIPPGRHER